MRYFFYGATMGAVPIFIFFDQSTLFGLWTFFVSVMTIYYAFFNMEKT